MIGSGVISIWTTALYGNRTIVVGTTAAFKFNLASNSQYLVLLEDI